MFLAVYENVDDFKGIDGFVRGLYVSLIAILIVFTILVVICVCVGLLKKLNKEENPKVENVSPVTSEVKNTTITDEDMMVAALVATIEHKSQTNMDAKLVSIKEIK